MPNKDLQAQTTEGARRKRYWLRDCLTYAGIILTTFLAIELILQALQFSYLRRDDWGTLRYQHDAELGWTPIPNSSEHNSLGLRDIEYLPGPEPTIMFLGDSLVWGMNIQANERFTDLLRPQLPNFRIVNAGVAGYGTDQEYLHLKRLWNSIQPAIVVLIVDIDNDRRDNTRNVRYFSHKPYFQWTADRGWQFRGQPVPKARGLYFRDNWIAAHSMLVRLLISAYIEISHPRVTVDDPTEHLVGMIRDFVQERGARLLVGLQYDEPQLEAYLQAQKIPYVSFDGAEEDRSRHWTPKGNVAVTERLLAFFAQTGILD